MAFLSYGDRQRLKETITVGAVDHVIEHVTSFDTASSFQCMKIIGMLAYDGKGIHWSHHIMCLVLKSFLIIGFPL